MRYCLAKQEARCAYAMGIMAVYWCTEALPMAATALLPVMLFPFLGVIGSKELCANYLKVSRRGRQGQCVVSCDERSC